MVHYDGRAGPCGAGEDYVNRPFGVKRRCYLSGPVSSLDVYTC